MGRRATFNRSRLTYTRRMRSRSGLCLVLFVMAACSANRSGGGGAGPSVPVEYKGFRKVATIEAVPGLKIYRYRSEKSGLDLLLSPKPGIKAVAVVTAFKV